MKESENKQTVIELFDSEGKSRGFYNSDNRVNDLTGKEWVFNTRSVIPKSYPPSYQFKLRNQHGGQKPPELCAELIQTFTKNNALVLDPFMGVGGTLIGATIAQRRAVGIEIEPKWIDVYKQVCDLESIETQTLFCGDSNDIIPTLPYEFDFILTDVPYWNMDTAKRSVGKFKRVGKEIEDSKLRKNLNRFNHHEAKDKQGWLNDMADVFKKCKPKLKQNGYMAVFVGEMFQNGEYHFIAAELADAIRSVGYTPKANIIWYDVSKQLHVYGYRYAFIPSMVHQNILIFRNEKP